MKLRNSITALVIIFVAITTCKGQISTEAKSDKHKIQIALLLDISGSMDQLLLKAKSQFWRIATYLNNGTKHGKNAIVEFSVITYGGAVGVEDNYTTILSNLTTELDSISDKLFEIQIGGSEEHCWTAIDIALEHLHWSRKKGDLRIILIAGNESFEQGSSDSKTVAGKARNKDVIINTVYCTPGQDNSNIEAEWKAAATLTNGSYFTLTLRDSLNMKETSMDKKLETFNNKLNDTYVPFGDKGETGMKRMITHDRNSKLSGIPFFRERVAFKAQPSFVNPDWDLVDAIQLDSTILTKIKKESLAEGLRSMEKEEIVKLLSDKWYTRQSYKEAIRLRHEMIKKHFGESDSKNTLDLAVKEIVDKEGKKKGFVFK
jgi:hypothetical protein